MAEDRGLGQPALTDFDGYFRASALITSQKASKSRSNEEQSVTNKTQTY